MGATASPTSVPSAGASPPSRIRQLVDLARSVPWQAVSALVALIFVLLQVVYALFYSSFGVSPEEVGLGFGQSLAQAAIGGIFVTVLVLAISLTYVVWLWFGLRQTGRKLAQGWKVFREAPPKDRTAFVLYLLHRLSILAVFVSIVVIRDRLEGSATWMVPVEGGLVVAWLFSVGDRVRNPLQMEPGKPYPKGLRRAESALGWGFVLAAVVLWFVLPFQAIRDANAVRDGVSTPVGPFVPWQAPRARVSWTQEILLPVLAEAEGHCLMYLGQGNGISILYDVDSARTLRLPSGSLAVSVVMAPNGRAPSPCQK